MKIGFIGLGKMGGNMVLRLLKNGHEVVAYDRSEEAVAKVVAKGAEGAASLEELVAKLPQRKVLWMMVPAGKPVEGTIEALKPMLSKNDILIDGGNSNWHDTQARGESLAENGIHYVDCGVSGGVWGLDNGYCLMSGGDAEACAHVEPVFITLAPENGYLYCGPSGAGHFVKMVHNGIEYGMMQAYAEGFEIMEKSPFDLDLRAISSVWQYGSVIRSWLLELAELAFADDPKLTGIKDYVSDSGEGRWTVQAAIDFDVPAPIITASLFARFRSRQEESFGNKVLAALRNQFGGHAVKRK
ncbi:MAG TPA: decarboxylating 6-phosphogluconate dehydrogenase [Calditrichia bacterium]|nr:decarboxylating 6-phosphogluconate dehydrogenase [Calditrichia bacterium]